MSVAVFGLAATPPPQTPFPPAVPPRYNPRSWRPPLALDRKMSRLLFALVLAVSSCPALASEPPPTTATRYIAKVSFLKVDGGKQLSLNTEVIGTKGTPLKTALGGKDGLTLTLDMHDLPNTMPTQYVAQFKLVEIGKDGKENVLSAPALVTTVGRPAKIMVGQEKGDRIEVDLVVREISGASSAASGHPNKSPSQIIVGGVTPRIIIQEEEEEKLGVVSP